MSRRIGERSSQIRIVLPPVQADLFRLVDGANQQPYANGQQFNIRERNADIASYDEAFIQHSVEDIDKVSCPGSSRNSLHFCLWKLQERRGCGENTLSTLRILISHRTNCQPLRQEIESTAHSVQPSPASVRCVLLLPGLAVHFEKICLALSAYLSTRFPNGPSSRLSSSGFRPNAAAISRIFCSNRIRDWPISSILASSSVPPSILRIA
jgi:hypothetical protein